MRKEVREPNREAEVKWGKLRTMAANLRIHAVLKQLALITRKLVVQLVVLLVFELGPTRCGLRTCGPETQRAVCMFSPDGSDSKLLF